jgi:hypothetical protein
MHTLTATPTALRLNRLAMIAAAGLILQGVTTHQGGLENLANMSS